MSQNVATKAPEVEIRVRFIHREGNKSGTLAILRESEDSARSFRDDQGITTKWLSFKDPVTGEKLEAFGPIEHGQLRYIEDEVGLRDGEVGIATFAAVRSRGRVVWWFRSICRA